MRYLPLGLVIIGLLGVVTMMAGPGESRTRALRGIALTLIVLLGMALMFGLVARDSF